jgi:hypothetical protein
VAAQLAPSCAARNTCGKLSPITDGREAIKPVSANPTLSLTLIHPEV